MNNYNEQLQWTITTNNYNEQLQRTITMNNYNEKLQWTITTNNYNEQLQRTITANNYTSHQIIEHKKTMTYIDYYSDICFYSFIKTATVVPYNLQTVYDCLIALVNSTVFPVFILWDVWKLGIWTTKHQIDRWD